MSYKPPPRPPPPPPPQADINAATSADLQKLEAIGPARAGIIMRGMPYSCGRALKSQLMDKKGIAHALSDTVVASFEVRGCGNGDGGGDNGKDCEEWRARRRMTSPGGAIGWTTCAKEAEDDAKLLKGKDNARLIRNYDGKLEDDKDEI